MHVHRGAWRNLFAAIALVTFALPLATPLATPVGAQGPFVGTPPHSVNTTGGDCTRSLGVIETGRSIANDPNCYVGAEPGLSFNLIGSQHTVTFTCGQAVGPDTAGANPRASRPTDLSGGAANAGAGVVPGCYDVSASIIDEFGGSPTFSSATCGHSSATLESGTANCAAFQSPLCPVGSYTVAAPCDTADPTSPKGSQFDVTFNSGAPHSYLITFTGYTPLLGTCSAVTNTANGTCAGGTPACPADFTYIPGPHTLTTSVNAPPFQGQLIAPDGVCQFFVSVEKKYVEITALKLIGSGPCAVGASAATLFFSEALKSYFGPACRVVAIATGEVILKNVGNCATHPTGAPADAQYGDFPKGSTYQCIGGILSVIIPNIADGSIINPTTDNIHTFELDSGPVPIIITGGGSASASPGRPTPTIGRLCAGFPNTNAVLTYTGAVAYVCPSSPGAGTVQACLANGFGQSVDTQASICSNIINVTYLLPNAKRVVPYVRWAGEKQVLTKCFGGGFLQAGAAVEFTLTGGGGPTAQAALIPASTPAGALTGYGTGNGNGTGTGNGTGVGGPGGGTATSASQDTVWTVTDENGCATVILFAAGEGQVNVDASLFSTAAGNGGGNEIINEHAFEVFYLKFDHLDIENIRLTNVKSDTLTSSLTFTANPPSFNPGLDPVNFPSYRPFGNANATFQLPNPPGTNPPTANGYSLPLCNLDYLRAMVHGFFEIPGNPSGRPATQVSIPGAPSGASASYGLPAGRWVLPEDWPVLATYAGFFSTGNPFDPTPSSVYAWDLNSGWVFNPGGERAVLCEGPTVAPGPNTSGITNLGAPLGGGAIDNGFTDSNGVFHGANETRPDENPLAQAVSYGPCFSQDQPGKGYQTGPDENAFDATVNEDATGGYNQSGEVCTGVAGDPLEGLTLGVGPFDATQTCTNPYPLANTPSGSLQAFGPGPAFGLGPISSNSTYLPNGTLNQWDAPMPPAQVSFGITGGPGFLNQVNKTGLYVIPTDQADRSIYPDPFYSEAIPASPLIPPVANNGGYLWDTFGFTGGYTLGPTTSGAFVAGESTSVSPVPFGPCGETTTVTSGFTAVASPGGTTNCFVGAAGAPDATVTPAECAAIGGSFQVVSAGPPANGTCEIPAAPARAAGGINVTNFGPGCPATTGATPTPQEPNPAGAPAGDYTVEVANGTGFVVGMTVEVYSTKDGHTIATSLTLDAVTPGPDQATDPTATLLTLGNVPAGLCVPVFQGIFVSEQTAVTVPGSNAGLQTLDAGDSVSIYEPSGRSATTTIAFVTGNTLYLQGSEALARELGGCIMSRGPVGGPVAFGTCEPGVDYLQAGSVISTGPNNVTVPLVTGSDFFPGHCTPDSSCNQGPYPFWQWVPNPASATGRPQSATVYSDNHGEAIVSLETGVISQLAPVAGKCPTGYNLTPDLTNCILDFSTLGTSAAPGGTAFQNILAARRFTGAAPGCILTAPNGTQGPVPAATAGTTATAAAGTTAVAGATATATPGPGIGVPAVGPTGPGDNQICINNLGGIEFGANAALGTTTVQAVADYPYFRGLHAPIASAAINKVFTSAFTKSVTVSPLPSGLAGPAGTTTYTVTIRATDICGNAIVGEPVDVFALGNAGAVVLAPLGNGVPNGTSAATVFLDATGQATLSLEVLATAIGNQGLVIKAVFPFERVERFAPVLAGQLPNQTATVLYTPGYNMVGGPPGSNFSSAEALFSYNPATQTYGNATASAQSISSAAPSCTGYFAYFAAATAVNLPVTSKAGDTASCTLQAGYNLVGNPFASPAALPSGVTAYHFNGTTYDVVSSIPVGGAVFLFNDGTINTVTLTAT